MEKFTCLGKFQSNVSPVGGGGDVGTVLGSVSFASDEGLGQSVASEDSSSLCTRACFSDN